MTKHGKDPQSKHNKGFLFGGDQRNQKKPTPHPLSKQGRAAASANAQVRLKPLHSAPWPDEEAGDAQSDDKDNVHASSRHRLRRLEESCIPSKGLPPELRHLCSPLHPEDPHSTQSCAGRAAFLRVPTSALHPAAGQYGLFAAIDIPPRTPIAPYFGILHTEAESDPASDYDLAMQGPAGERLAIDATHAGSIARCE